MKISEIIERIEAIAPLWGQADWDASGLQVASDRGEAKKIAVCLDPLPEQIAKALDCGAEFVLSHHPLAMRPQMPNRHDGFYRVVKMLMRADVPLYSAHTSLDVNLEGPSGWLARAFDLRDTQFLEETHKPTGAFPTGLGFGMVGNLPEAISKDAFLACLLKLLKLDHAIVCGPCAPDQIRSIAFCAGSGSSLCQAAFAACADIFITGDVKYHSALETPIAVVDVGHFSFENEMMRHMADMLRESLPGVEVDFVDGQEPFRIVAP